MRYYIYLIFLLVFGSLASASYYLEEGFVDITTSGTCVVAVPPYTNTFDGDWNTGHANPGPGACNMMVNYTMPTNAKRELTRFILKDITGTNVSIIIPTSCWVYSRGNNLLSMRIRLDDVPVLTDIQCEQVGGMRKLYNDSNNYIYETGILYGLINESSNVYYPSESLDVKSKTVYDLSSSNLDGTFSGVILNPGTFNGGMHSSYNTGPFGGSAKFDGVNDKIILTSFPLINMDNDFTITGWFYLNENKDGAIFYDEKGNIRFSINYHNSGELRAGFYNGTNYFSDSGSVSINQWTHFLYYWDGINNGLLYINNILQTGTNTISNGGTDGSWFGARAGSANFFNGSIDNFMIFNNSVVSERTNIYQSSSKYGSPVTNGLIASYIFEPEYDNQTHTMDTNFLSVGANKTYETFGSMAFDGVNDYVNIGTALAMPNNFSAFAWIKSNLGSNDNLVVMSQQDGAGTGRSWLYMKTDDKVYTGLRQPGGLVLGSTSTINPQNWNHIGVIYNGSHRMIVINGVIDTIDTEGSFEPATGNILFGTSKTLTAYWNGSIDEVKIFNEPLEIAQVRDLYLFGDEDYYNFNVTLRPHNGTSIPQTYVNLSYTININNSGVVNCTLTQDGTTIHTADNVGNGTHSYLQTGLDVINATYNYTITCSRYGRVENANTSLVFDNTIRFVKCSAGLSDAVALNFSFYDTEGAPVNNVSFDGFFTMYQGDSSSYHQNFSFVDNQTYDLCIYPYIASSMFSAQIEYYNINYTRRTYYFSNTAVDNITNYYSLYLNSSADETLVQFTVTDEDDDPVIGAFIYVMEYDIGTNTSTTTEILETDNSGQTIGHIILDTQRYRFMIRYLGEVRLLTNPIILTLTSYNFQITLGEDYFIDFDVVQDVSCLITYTNATTTFDFIYIDPSDTITRACMTVKQISGLGIVDVYSNCNSSTSGTMDYTIIAPGGYTYIASSYIVLNGQDFVCGTPVSHKFDRRFEVYGQEGIFASFMITLSLVMIGIWSPVIAVFLMGTAVLLSTVLGVFSIGWEILISFVIVVGIAMYKLSQK